MKRNVVKQLSWKPVRRGAVYCSPACGGGCTRAEFERASSAAAKLAKKLGSAWKPHVWENLGWHYEVVNGSLSVMSPKRPDGRFGAQFKRGSVFWASTAQGALAALRAHLVLERKRITAGIDALT